MYTPVNIIFELNCIYSFIYLFTCMYTPVIRPGFDGVKIKFYYYYYNELTLLGCHVYKLQL